MKLDESLVFSFTQYMRKFSGMYQSLSKLLSKQLDTKNDLMVVDVGCGPGLLIHELHRDLPRSTLIGVDISNEMLHAALNYLDGLGMDRIVLTRASSEAIPLKDTSVDAIVSRYSLPYWPHPSYAFDEFYRILKPGGVLFLEALNADFPHWKLALIKYKMIFRKASDEVITYHIDAYKAAYTLTEIADFLNKANFTMQKVIESNSGWKFIIIATK